MVILNPWSGYIGDGEICYDIDECTAENDCHPAAICENNAGSYECSRYRDGHAREGDNFSGINICTGGFHDCHSSASCAVAADSYTCTCIAGYIGDGKSCVSEDECSGAFKYEDLEAKFKQLEAVIVT